MNNDIKTVDDLLDALPYTIAYMDCDWCKGEGKLHKTKRFLFWKWEEVISCPKCYGRGNYSVGIILKEGVKYHPSMVIPSN